MAKVRLPHNGWTPRPHQRDLWNYLEDGGTRAVAIWHRRAGKDEVALHHMAVAAHQKIATYWHMLPEAAQARKAIWEAVNPGTGIRRIDEAFPQSLRAATREQEMFIRFKSGSTWQVVGSDNYNSLVGSPPHGVVFSEWALANPSAWGYISPIVRENGGWAMFITTPRGKNHAYSMLETARREGWYHEVLSADKTGVFGADQLDEERRELVGIYGSDMGNALFEQEYMCSFEAAILGSYWGAEMAEAERAGRIGDVEVEPGLPVHTAWDLGVGDDTVIWFWQMVGREIRVVDYYAAHSQGLEHYAAIIREKGYRPGDDFVPHDAKVRELGTGRSRVETMVRAGLRPRLVADHKLDDGINAARQTIPRCWFDASRCAVGLEALKAYRRKWDEQKKTFSDGPLHDWASHSADGFRYLSMAWRELAGSVRPEPSRIVSVGSLNSMRMNDLWKPAAQQRVRI